MAQSTNGSLVTVREHLALILTNDDGPFKDIRSNLNIFTSQMRKNY